MISFRGFSCGRSGAVICWGDSGHLPSAGLFLGGLSARRILFSFLFLFFLTLGGRRYLLTQDFLLMHSDWRLMSLFSFLMAFHDGSKLLLLCFNIPPKQYWR